MAATARWVKRDHARRSETFTARPAGETQVDRGAVSVPARRSRIRSCASQRAVADVEGLVVDEEPDQLAVGDVDDRLARLGVAVAGLGVGQRAQLVDAVEVGAGQAVRLALVEVAAQADVAVGEREDRLALGQRVEVERRLPHAPRLDGEGGVVDHRRQLEQLGEVRDDDVGAVGLERVGLADPVHADHAAESRRPGRPRRRPGRPRRRRRGRARPQPAGAGQERVGRRLAPQVLPARPRAVDAALEQIDDPAATSTSWQLALEETTARRSPASRAARRYRATRRRARRPARGCGLQHELVLAVAEAVDRARAGWVVGGALGQLDAPGLQEERGAVGARLAVDVVVVVGVAVEGLERRARRRRSGREEVVEHLLPRPRVDVGRLGEHAVEVEQAGGDRSVSRAQPVSVPIGCSPSMSIVGLALAQPRG